MNGWIVVVSGSMVVSMSWAMLCSSGETPVGWVPGDDERSEGRLAWWAGETWSCIACEGKGEALSESEPKYGLPAIGPCSWKAACRGLSSEPFPVLASLDATRGIGGSCGGNGDTGELEA